MPSYSVTAINIGSFPLGEADKVLTVFSSERGLLRAVAKSARKPGTKMAGRADVLNVNRLFLAVGRTFEIITQAESVETFPSLRNNLASLSYGLYYAELTQAFAQGLQDECAEYFDFLLQGLRAQASAEADSAWLCLEFELGLLDMLGYRPELTYCLECRDVLGEYNLATFNRDLGGILCRKCAVSRQSQSVRENGRRGTGDDFSWKEGVRITPLVWKHLVMASQRDAGVSASRRAARLLKPGWQQSILAARRLVQGYIEQRAGRKMKSLELLEQIKM